MTRVTRVGAPALGGGRGDRCVLVPVGDAPGRPVHGRPHALDVDEHVGAAVLHRLEAADGPAELHPVLGVLDGQVEHPLRDAEHLRAVGDRGHVADPFGFGPAPEVGARRTGQGVGPEPADRAGHVHGRLGRRLVAGQVDGPDAVVLAHDHHVGHRRERDHPVEPVRHRGDPAAVDETRAPLGAGQHVERDQLAEDRRRRHRRPHLLEEHGRLHPAEADATGVLGHGDAAPALVDHRRPQRLVRPATGVDRLAHDLG